MVTSQAQIPGRRAVVRRDVAGTDRFRVALLGSWDGYELNGIRDVVSAQCDAIVIGSWRDDGGAQRFAECDVAIVSVHWPGEFDATSIERLRRAAPPAGVVAVVGSWCEGDLRTGRPLPVDVRLHWYEFVPWWQHQLKRLNEQRLADWQRPEISLADPNSRATQIHVETQDYESDGRGRLIAIVCNQRDAAVSLAAACSQRSWATTWVRRYEEAARVRGASAMIWDGGQLDDVELADLCRIHNDLGNCACVALSHFPRADRIAAARRAGVAAVIAKPFSVDAFNSALADLCNA